MINPVFINKYNEEAFIDFLQGFIPGLSFDKKRSEIRKGFQIIQQIAEAGQNKLDLVVFVAKLESSINARVEITKNTYAVLKNHARSNALVAYISDDSPEWRLSLITTKVVRTKDGVKESVSNPRRFSYVLGPNAKVATPSKMLQGPIESIIDLENKFSLAIVSKEFFTKIATQYSRLVGGTRGEGRKAVVYERTLKLGNTDNAINANFAIRLIGRLVFCWFLKQKKGHLNNPLIPSEILSFDAVKTIGDYYHSICVPLFFEVLNKQQSLRPTFYSYSEYFDKVPFLNGGLFQDHPEDNHKFNRTIGMSERRGVVDVPDVWFSELFQIFEEYNFTIDENTSIDTELSIDPEMLGRIFENLLAEVNPETGTSARKSTGSFYTPREIVDFMVEESLIAHLITKTSISEVKLRSLSSYNLDDDASNPIDEKEKKLLVEAIHNTTVLDPACGSGAFPIGVLQRLVHMLGVLDPECSIYLGKVPPEMRRLLQKHDPKYIRKLSVIRECIHGVDIQPIAIDISRLRCFLTLVVDQHVDDSVPNRGIEPLPNLDFKFVCANTLIKPPLYDNPLFGDDFAEELGDLVDEYFAPADQNHKLITVGKLKDLISEKTKEELKSIMHDTGIFSDQKFIKSYKDQKNKIHSERERLIDLWDSYKNIFDNKQVGFFDTRYFFPLVHRQGGFDIIIANPPYVKEYVNKSAFDGLRNSPYYQGKMDLWYFFACLGIDLLKNDGVLCFIAQNNWVTSYGASKMREKVATDSQIVSLIDFADYKIFEAGIQTGIMMFKKNAQSDKYIFDYRKLKSNSLTIDNVVALLNKEENETAEYLSPEFDRHEFRNKKFTFSDDKTEKVLQKIYSKGNFQLDPNKEVAQGIVPNPDIVGTGNIKKIPGSKINSFGIKKGDGVFVTPKNFFKHLTDQELSVIKPLYEPTDLARYTISKDYSKQIIYITKNDNINLLPNLKKHLEKYKEIMNERRENKNGRLKYYHLHWPRDKYFFEQGPKILSIRKCVLPTFAFTADETYVMMSMNVIRTQRIDLKYLTALLNSKITRFWLRHKGKMQGNNYQIDKDPLVNLPILDPELDTQERISVLSQKIIEASRDGDLKSVEKYENEVNSIFYDIYDLSPEEIAIVENK